MGVCGILDGNYDLCCNYLKQLCVNALRHKYLFETHRDIGRASELIRG
jgi:hypothetical protein